MNPSNWTSILNQYLTVYKAEMRDVALEKRPLFMKWLHEELAAAIEVVAQLDFLDIQPKEVKDV